MRYRRHRVLFSVALFAAACGGALAAQTAMQPGLWEITTEMDMPGMAMKVPPQTLQHCYTAADLAQGNAVPQQGDNPDCRMSDYKVDGDTATWSMECGGLTPMRATGTTTSTTTHYSGSMKSVMQGPGGTMETTTRWEGRRIGDCP